MKNLKYGLDEIPKFAELLSLSFYWLVVITPILIIGGRIVSDFHFSDAFEKTIYVQKVFFVSGLTILFQILFGHRLPLISGPSAILIAGIYAINDYFASYTSMAICGLFVFFLATKGKVYSLQKLFTQKIVALVFLFIIITLLPLVLDLITSEGDLTFNVAFSIIFVSSLLILTKLLRGFWASNLLLVALFSGTVIYLLIFPRSFEIIEPYFAGFQFHFSFRFEVFISFLFFYLALIVNDVSSIYSVAKMVEAEKIDERISRGVSITGLSNFLSGILSVVGTVNYAMSPGIIASTRSASRFALLPVAFMLILFSFFPILIHCFAMIPKTVIASVFIYVLCHQCIFALKSLKIEGFGSFLTILISILVCFSITFAPKWVFENIPDVLEPVVGNGFIAGLLVAIIFEQVLRKKDKFISETRGHGKEGSG